MRVVSAVAVAAGAFASTDSQASVIQTKSTPTVVTNGQTVDVDVNNDGTSDVSIGNQNNAKNGQNRYYVNANSATSNLYATSPYALDAANPVRPTAFGPGALIGPIQSYGADSGGLSNTLAGSGLGDSNAVLPANSGYFAQDGTTVNYIGVQINLPFGGDPLYGYVGVTLTPAGQGENSIATIVSAAYEDSGAAITTPLVPEPASLAMLAIGAGALLKRRHHA